MTSPDTLLGLAQDIVTKTVEPNAIAIDRDGSFPRTTIQDIEKVGLLGLLSSPDVRGMVSSPVTTEVVTVK